MFDGTTVRSATLWVSLGVLSGAGITLGVILVGGVSVADEPGSPLGISVVTVAPDSALPSASPTSIPTHSIDDDDDNDDNATVVPAPSPTEVELGDDNDGESNSGSGSGSGSSGGGDSGGSGSGSSGSGSGGGSND